MTPEATSRWLEADLEPELLRVLESSAEDEPSAEQLRQLEARMALVLAAGTVAASAATVTQAKFGLSVTHLGMAWTKAAIVTKVAIAAGAVAVLSATPVVVKRISEPRVDRATTTRAVSSTPAAKRMVPGVVAVIGSGPQVANSAIAPAADLPVKPEPVTLRSRATHTARERKVSSGPRSQLKEVQVVPQLEQEVALVKQMRAAINDDPCEVLRLSAQHRATFVSPLLGPERDHLELLALSKEASCDE